VLLVSIPLCLVVELLEILFLTVAYYIIVVHVLSLTIVGIFHMVVVETPLYFVVFIFFGFDFV